jgi:hypothetical protein
MQQRRGTAAQWTAANPVLAAGEIGFATDTRKFKMGDGTRTWSQLEYFANAAELEQAITNVVGLAPETLNTLSEISDALGDNPDFLSALATNTRLDAAIVSQSAALTTATNYASGVLNTHVQNTLQVHGIPDTSLLATTAHVATAKSEAITAAGTDATSKAATAKSEAITAAGTAADTKISTAVAALTSLSVGLGSVNDTPDAAKPVSSAQASAIATAKTEAITAAGTAADTKVSTHNTATANVHGIADTSALALTATVNSALDLKAPIASPTFTGTVSGVTKAHVGLGSVDNTADADKPVSSATTTALGLKAPVASPTFTGTVTIPAGASISGFAPLASPALTGTPTAPTAAAGTSTTQVATTAFVGTAVSNLVASAPAALDTLNELATALGNDANFSTTLTTNLGLKAPKADPTFTGTVTVSASGVAFSDGTQTKAGVPSITNIPTALAAGAQTIAASRADQFIPLTGAVVITLPATGYTTGQSIDFFQESGTGAYFASTNSVVGTPGLKFRTTYSVATAMKTASGWLVFGDLSA